MKVIWTLAMACTVVFSIKFSATTRPGIVLGLSVFASGAVLTVISALFLTKSYPGLVTTGPYSLSRHPFYLGLLIMLTGVVVYRGSYVGAAFLIPSVGLSVSRAQREERKLCSLYPQEYGEYMSKTPFIIKAPGRR